jgi:hypothetical protein
VEGGGLGGAYRRALESTRLHTLPGPVLDDGFPELDSLPQNPDIRPAQAMVCCQHPTVTYTLVVPIV